MIKQILILIFLFSAWQTKADIDFNDRCKIAYRKTMELNFTAAKKIIEKEKSANGNNLIPFFIENYIDFLTIIIDESSSEYENFLKETQILAEKFYDEGNLSPYAGYCLTDLYLQMTFISALDESYMSAAMKIRKAKNTILKNEELFPDFVPNKKALGIMNIAFGSVPKSYGWIMDILGLEGSVTKGLDMLKSLTVISTKNKNYSWLFTDAALCYTFSAVNFGDSKNKNIFLDNLFAAKANDSSLYSNRLLCYSAASYYRHNGNNEKVIGILQQATKPSEAKDFYYLDYMLGMAYLYKMQPETTGRLMKFLKEYKGKNYRKSALQRIAWFNIITGNTDDYKIYMSMIKSTGATFVDSDKQAQKAAENEDIPNKYLLKCRLLFDGGYYNEAARVFKLNNPKVVLSTDKEFLEYNYRMGRIYDEWGKTSDAIIYYRKTIAMGNDKPYYFAANASLHLGYIYEKQKNYAKAKESYDLCLDLDFDEYRNSITQKAKAGLNRVKNR